MAEVHNAPPDTQPKEPIRRRGRRRDRTQALALQALLVKAAQDPKTPASAKASCAVAWSRVQESRRILEGKPLPGQLRPDLEQRKASKARSRKALLTIASTDLPAQQSSTQHGHTEQSA